MQEIFAYDVPRRIRQSLSEDGIDCIEFAPNDFGVEKLYFDIHRKFDVEFSAFSEDFEDDFGINIDDIPDL